MRRPWPRRPRLVFCDVDGTLVTREKKLTPAVMSAVRSLASRGIAFTIASARPPFGLDHVAEPLGIDLPIAAFNGGFIRQEGEGIVSEHLLDAEDARQAIAFFERHELEIWAFTPDRWLSVERHGPYVEKEAHTIRRRPERVDDLGPHLGRIGKIVGVSEDFAQLARCEAEAQARFGGRMSVARSQKYYLDVTHRVATKSQALSSIAQHLGVDLGETVAIGDGINDIGMLRAAGFAIAMGNAAEPVRQAADYVTATNDEDGVAGAIARLLREVEEVQDRT